MRNFHEVGASLRRTEQGLEHYVRSLFTGLGKFHEKLPLEVEKSKWAVELLKLPLLVSILLQAPQFELLVELLC